MIDHLARPAVGADWSSVGIPRQKPRKGHRGRRLHAGNDVLVDVERKPGAGVPKALAGHLERHARLETGAVRYSKGSNALLLKVQCCIG